MEKELEELIQNRKNLVQTHTKNGFTNGIHHLLTDLYPDTAHFIYELLQNAEDMSATKVRFTLREDGICFEHNGTKRSFNISDIKAITSIGDNEQKKQDVNSIGKFGVGFKAVFAYTSTPIIHSGQYHFKIVDYFIPEFEDVEHTLTRDTEGVEWTKFEFPFNNPRKKSNVAYEECLKGLQALDKSTILFLQNIRKIEYQIYQTSFSCDVGYVERTGDEDRQEGAHIITINTKSCGMSKAPSSKWFKVHKLVDIVDENGNKKYLPIAVAYNLARDSKTNKTKICPVAGKVFIYFPAEKETSNLKFHINAPFASTVARDSVQNRSENNELMEQVSKLVVESLEEIKKQGLLEKSVFEVLPNVKDELTPFYSRIFKAVCPAFRTHAYLPTKDEKSFVTSVKALLGPGSLSYFFKPDDMKTLFGNEKIWIFTPDKNTREDYFLQSLGIESFTYETFCNSFEDVGFRQKIEGFLTEKTKEWLKEFYYLLVLSRKENHMRFSSALQNIRLASIIRNSEGVMCKPSDVYILSNGQSCITKDISVVDEYFVGSLDDSDSRLREIRSCFHNELGVQYYGAEVEIEKRLKRYQQDFVCDDTYFEDILTFAKYCTTSSNGESIGKTNASRSGNHNSIDFSKYPLFFYEVNNSGQTLLLSEVASSLFLGQSYECYDGEVLADIGGGKILWNGYAKRYEPDELQLFLNFVKKCGIRYELKIERANVRNNPLFWKELCKVKKFGNVESSDYDIPDLDVLLNKKTPSISKIIWNVLLREGKNTYPAYWLAQFKPNQSTPFRTCDSTLICKLKQAKWLPKKDCDDLFVPEEVLAEELPGDFVYDSGNRLLQALMLGSKIISEKQKYDKIQADAKELGCKLVSEEKYKKFEEWEARQSKRESKSLNGAVTSIRDLLETKKTSSTEVIEDRNIDGSVYNVERREKYIGKTFKNSLIMKSRERKVFSSVCDSSKEEKETLNNWYYGKCQMCGMEIVGYDGKRHFEARNIISVNELPTKLQGTIALAWNSLCLCPNCAMKYEVCSRDSTGFYDQIMNTEVIPGDSENIRLHIELDGKIQYISYIPKHFLTLKKVVQLIDRTFQDQEE